MMLEKKKKRGQLNYKLYSWGLNTLTLRFVKTKN